MKRAAWVLFVVALPAQAYERTKNTAGVCTWWPSRARSFQIDSQGTPDAPSTDVFNAIRLSFQTWGAVSCSDLTFAEEPLSTDPHARLVGYTSGATNHNLVLFRTQACRDVVPANDPCLSSGGCGNKFDCWDEVHGLMQIDVPVRAVHSGRTLPLKPSLVVLVRSPDGQIWSRP